jgi:hypothetical protein
VFCIIKTNKCAEKNLRQQSNDSFKVEYGYMICKDIFKIDKAGIWYNPVLHTIIAYAGRLTTIAMTKKHSGKMTAVLRVSVLV